MDVKRFEFLCQIADYGSFSKAASVIGITQPALGRQIRKFEEECGAELLYRNGRGASLTPEGLQLLLRVRPLLKEMQAAVAELQSEKKSVGGAVSIGMTPALSSIIGFSLLKAVEQQYPKIALNIITGYSGYVLEWLTSGRVDVGIIDSTRRAKHLIFDQLGELRLSLISAINNATSAGEERESVNLADLPCIPLVLPTRSHGLRRTMDVAAANAGITLNIAHEIDAHYLVREIVLAGAAHTIMAAQAVHAEIERGQLVARLLNPAISTRLLCGTSSNRPVTEATRSVLKLLKEIIAQIVGEKNCARSLYPGISSRPGS
jgi:LysR family nitrogen assimilation transcriptional regulator